jgi:Carboxypeptidase regulatory-like domain/TonB dependent receptor
VNAQDSRATILGKVTDPSGAAAPRAHVDVVNQATSVVTSGTTNEQGNYSVPYLMPGVYSLSVELAGFKKYVRQGLELRVDDKLTLDVGLSIGASTESITVANEMPLIETNSPALGGITEHKSIVDLPLSGGNAMTLVRLAAGSVNTGAPNHPSLLAGVGAINAYTVDGTPANTTEYNVDGASVMTGRWPAFLPPEDMIDEFKVSTATYDAADGRSSGSSINVSLRSGTNQFHGTLYEYHSDIALFGIDMFQRQTLYNPATGPVTHAKDRSVNPQFVINRPGGSIGGPLVLPHYNGRNRTFWMFAFEDFVRPATEPGGIYRTVPTDAERKGDFSTLLPLGSSYQIYDPATTTATAGGRYSRQPFPGNIIPQSRLDPTAQKLLAYYPQAMLQTPDGENNYVFPSQSRNIFQTYNARVDEVISDRQHLSGKVNFAKQQFISGENLPPAQGIDTQGDINWRINHMIGLDHVITVTPHLVINTRYDVNYQTIADFPMSQNLNLSNLGFSQALTALVPTQYASFPSLSVQGMTTLGGQANDYSTTNFHVAGSQLYWTHGSHNVKAGVDFRLFRSSAYNWAGMNPSLSFGTTYTNGPVDNSPGAPIGQGLAAFLLGIPSSGSVAVNPSSAIQSWYLGEYVQDDWRATSRLTVNLGVRLEHESPVTERYDRAVGTFAFGTASPIASAAIAAYTANPPSASISNPGIAIPASQFSVNGGATFVGAGGQSRNLWGVNAINVSPRIGLAYTLNPKTVLRAGYGIYVLPQGADVVYQNGTTRQAGFSRTTSLVPTLDNGLTFSASLANPFPSGYLTPLGSQGGLSTNIGNAITVSNPKLPHAYSQRWSFTVQRQLPKNIVFEASYVGNRNTDQVVAQSLDALPAKYLSTSPVRDQATINLLTTQVPNPFFGLVPTGTSLATQKVALSQLLLPYPQFTGVTMDEPTGFSWYHSLQTRMERRFANGFTVQGNYTWSKLMSALSFQNAFATVPTRSIDGSDRPQVFNLTGIYEFPFGRGKPLLSSAHGIFGHIVSGWQMQATYEAESGTPISFGNIPFSGSLQNIVLPSSQRSPAEWFNTSAGFDTSSADALANNVRTFPLRLTGLRTLGVNLWNISATKNFRISERVRFQLRSEWLNATNHTFLAAPNTTPTSPLFGTINSNNGYPRYIYFVGKLYF